MIPPCDSTALMTQATRMLACGGAWGSKDGHFRRKWWDHSLATDQPLRRSAPASATSIVALGLTAHCSFRLIPPLRCIPHSGRSAPSPLIRGAFCRLPHGHTIPISTITNFPHCGSRVLSTLVRGVGVNNPHKELWNTNRVPSRATTVEIIRLPIPNKKTEGMFPSVSDEL